MENHKQKKLSMQKIIMIALGVLSLIGIAAGIFFYTKYNDIKDNPTAEIESRNQEESERVTTSLSQIILFNEEDPTVARIEDPTALQQSNPDFYLNAQPGDYLVLFPSRAIVYRESENKIVNVAPIINTQGIGNSDQAESDVDNASDTEAN